MSGLRLLVGDVGRCALAVVGGTDGAADGGPRREHVEGVHAEGATLRVARHGRVDRVLEREGDIGGGAPEAVVQGALDLLAVAAQHAAGAGGGALLGHSQAHGADLVLAGVVMVGPLSAGEAADEGVGGGVSAQRVVAALELGAVAGEGGQVGLGGGAVMGDGPQVWAVFEAAVERQGGEVVVVVVVWRGGRVGKGGLLDVAHGCGGA